ncbi:hypothetical protein F0A16_11265 [Salinicola corii]|uniref:Uncharacterized protein n=1 Tax=Salinicola corii TaxID=2606937 RepID=A0A640WE85_9GAMM|nr:hypothetical protein [Salinicola corii]KAA0018287.1 hypothetical protein F0A16_11265 [Salinicola corii]
MKFHKSLIALVVAASTLSPLAMAAPAEQSKPSAPHEARMAHVNPLKEAVVASWNLDEDKLAKLARADSDFHAGLQQLRGNDDQAAPEQRQAAMESLLQQQREQLADVLTDEQLRAYQMLERPRPPMMRHGGPRMDSEQMTAQLEQRYAPLFATWNLDQDQSAKVLNAERTFFDGLHQLKRPDLKSGDESRDARGAQFKQLLEQRHSALSAVLDDEQVTAFEALTQPPRGPHGGPRDDTRQSDELPAAG